MVYYALKLCWKALECPQIQSFRFFQEENDQQSFHYTFLGLEYLVSYFLKGM